MNDQCQYPDGEWGAAIPLGVGGANDGARPKRWLVIVNIALIPYLAVKFPREIRGYIRQCFEILIHGEAVSDGK